MWRTDGRTDGQTSRSWLVQGLQLCWRPVKMSWERDLLTTLDNKKFRIRIVIRIQEPWIQIPIWIATPLQKLSSKSVHNLLRYTAKCQFTLYLLMIKNPGKWSRIHERIRIATTKTNRLDARQRSVSPKNHQNLFWRYFVHNKWSHARTRTDTYTNITTHTHTHAHAHTHTHTRTRVLNHPRPCRKRRADNKTTKVVH